MTRIAILADTHIPSRAPALPDWVESAIERADITIHAGDFDSHEAYDTIEALSTRLVAVRGNADPALDLPEATTLEVDGTTFVVTHGTGSLAGYRDRVLQTVRRHGGAEAIGISGHTHERADVTVGGVRLLNPGSATGASPAAGATMLVATVRDGGLTVEVLDGP